MAFDSDITYLFTASSDGEARSWMPEIGDELKTFDGGRKAVACVVPKGELCKPDKFQVQFCSEKSAIHSLGREVVPGRSCNSPIVKYTLPVGIAKNSCNMSSERMDGSRISRCTIVY